MEITYRTRHAARTERDAFVLYCRQELDLVTKNATISIRRNPDSIFGRGPSYTLLICDSLKLAAQDWFGSDGDRLWFNR